MAEASENRRYPRVPIAKEAPKLKLHLVSKTGQTDTRVVRALDLSKAGMAFVDAAPVADGASVTIVLAHAGKSHRIIGKVTHCRALPDGAYSVGVRFVSITPIATDSPPAELTDSPLIDRLLISL